MATAVALLALTGCGDEPSSLVAMRMELSALKQELEYLREQAEELDPRIRNAEEMALQVFDNREAPLRLDCAGHRAGVLQTRLAPITVVCTDLTSTGAGLRVSLKLGNPTSGRLDGVRVTLYLGEGAGRGRADIRSHHETTTSLPSGQWRMLEIDVPGVPDGGSKEIALRAQIDSISLVQR
jgi:hypothetical protein